MSDQDLARRVAALEDREAVRALLLRYARALDSHDWPLLRTVFLPDAVADYGELEGRNEGVEEIIAACHRALVGLDSSQHLVGNVEVEVDGDAATASCYLHAQHYLVSPSGVNTFVVGGTYRDRIVRTPDGWRIEHRALATTWTDGNAAVFAQGLQRLRERGEEFPP
ncbi:nuclear transport factor 2 family protein [Patulibacter sp.]|uniref:nuclear transport factor 2 family protein n=1 Tax=Patulibacter sp. TaxID=1912859 RepID=UPI00272213CD|nr:nuclear transport factor 2 family protein [Patulibacter sp.]MDO9407709.1 nuclear transport factor 2 family protein [Patulibacter sp.]